MRNLLLDKGVERREIEVDRDSQALFDVHVSARAPNLLHTSEPETCYTPISKPCTYRARALLHTAGDDSQVKPRTNFVARWGHQSGSSNQKKRHTRTSKPAKVRPCACPALENSNAFPVARREDAPPSCTSKAPSRTLNLMICN